MVEKVYTGISLFVKSACQPPFFFPSILTQKCWRVYIWLNLINVKFIANELSLFISRSTAHCTSYLIKHKLKRVGCIIINLRRWPYLLEEYCWKSISLYCLIMKQLPVILCKLNQGQQHNYRSFYDFEIKIHRWTSIKKKHYYKPITSL